jgi:glucose/mannose transport system permease protein
MKAARRSVGGQGAWGRLGIYAFLVLAALFFLAPLYVMLVTSFKSMDEIRAGQLFAWPSQPTLAAWQTAWSEACTGLACEGVRVGFYKLGGHRRTQHCCPSWWARSTATR